MSVGENDVTVLGHDAESVAVAIKREAELNVGFFDDFDQVLQVFWLRRIGVMVREIAVNFAEHFHDFAAHRAQNFRRQFACRAVAAVNRDLHWTRELGVAHDAVNIGLFDVRCGLLATAGFDVAAFGARFERLNRVAPNGFASHHHFDAVVIRRVVTAGHTYAGARAQVMPREVRNWRRHEAKVNRVAAGGGDAVAQRLRE